MPDFNHSSTRSLLLTVWLAAVLGAASNPAAADDAAHAETDRPYTRSDRSHWSFQPIQQPAVPEFADVADQQLIDSPIDAFILEQLREDGRTFAPPADRRTLIRRLCFDLTGLPPNPEDIERFLDDDSADAWPQLIDELLARPAYGEKWGQHWLDVIRFAETEGFEYDRHHADAWRFRDYVIRAFNDNVPFREFVTDQIAGDERAADLAAKGHDPRTSPAMRDGLIAAGFHRLGPVRRNAGNPEIAFSRNEVLTEMTNAVGTVFLGLTVGCARCHDHFFDPFLQKDYYQLQAFFAATQEADVPLTDSETARQWKTQHDAVTACLNALKEESSDADERRRSEIRTEIETLQKQLPAPLPTLFSVSGDVSRRATIHLLARGDETKPLEPVGMRFPGVLIPDDQPALPADVDHPKTKLAQWITAEENPLAARVFVNRVWQYHFGRGLAETTNDFGINGEWPTHPELLDWLARRFIDSGGDLKALHRLILMSRTWQQSSASSASEPVDPDNRLLGRFSRRRLTAEELRDAMLQVSGSLNPSRTGPSVMVPVEPELVALLYKPTQWEVTPDRFAHNRRSIYLFAKRNLRLPLMEVFDQPDLQISCARRESSTHAPQALELLNGEFAARQSAAFAARLRDECGSSPGLIVDRAFELATGRLPTTGQRAAAVEFLAESPLQELTLAILNLNGVLYID